MIPRIREEQRTRPQRLPLKIPTYSDTTRLLLVEGRDAELFFEEMLKQLDLELTVETHDLGGVDEFHPRMKVVAQSDEFKEQVRFLGIIRDSETRNNAVKNVHSAFDSVCDGLKNANLPFPTRLGDVRRDNPTVSVFILPDGTRNGTIETLCLSAVEDDPAMPCILEFFDCLRQRLGERDAPEGQRHNFPKHLEKAKLRAFLSSWEEPDRLLGQAARANCFPWNHAAFEPVKEYLERLFKQ